MQDNHSLCELARLARDCYDGGVGLRDFEFFEGELDVLRASGETLIVVFRGTDSIQDWMSDLQIRQIPLPFAASSKIRVHYGFYRCYKVARPFLMRKIEDCVPKQVVIVGHSLGGGMATIFAYELGVKFPNLIVQNTTFGSPRVGNRAFAKHYDSLPIYTHRFVDPEDVIPTVPYVNYRHIGGRCECSAEGWRRTVGRRRSCFSVCCVCSRSEHSMENYCTSLDAQNKRE